MSTRSVRIPIDPHHEAGAALEGDLTIPQGASGIVVFAHGSGSSRRSSRNRQVAAGLVEAGLATLLFDLLTADEDEVDARTREHRFDIDLLTDRLLRATAWLEDEEDTRHLRVGLFGASTGAAAALRVAALRPDRIGPVVSRGGRPDLAGEESLRGLSSPVLLIVGGDDVEVLDLNRRAAEHIRSVCEVAVVDGATHLFPEPGALEEVTRLAASWFGRNLPDLGGGPTHGA
jgi:putative phosphoribosyl transferase